MGTQRNRPFSLPADPSSVATSHISKIWSKITLGRRKKRNNVRTQVESCIPVITISILPDDILLDIFDFCQSFSLAYPDIWKWDVLVHVCQRWRQIVFESPHRLNLRILCTYGTKNLDIWPPFPIVVDIIYRYPQDEDNIIDVLRHRRDRVCSVRLNATDPQWRKMAAVMQEPFPVLKQLEISGVGNVQVIPSGFLGGSTPCLQRIYLSGIPYPALPTLLLSTNDLDTLDLRNIPPTGYISPEELVVGLAALPRLKRFIIGFQSGTLALPDRIYLPRVTGTVLPALTFFQFHGTSEYLEDLVAQIDSPQLHQIYASYLNQLVDFQVGRLSEFIRRSVGPKITLFRHAHVTFIGSAVSFSLNRHATHRLDYLTRTNIWLERVDRQVIQIVQVLSDFSAILSTVTHLRIHVEIEIYHRLEGTDNVEWLHLLRQFSNVRTLHVSWELAGHVARALEVITAEMVAEVLPSLDFIFLAGQPASCVGKFVAVRQLSDHPITVVDTTSEFYEKVKSYVSE